MNDRPSPDPMSSGASLAATLLMQATLSSLVMRGLLPEAETDAIIDQCQLKLEGLQGQGGFLGLAARIAHSHLEETRKSLRIAASAARPRPPRSGG